MFKPTSSNQNGKFSWFKDRILALTDKERVLLNNSKTLCPMLKPTDFILHPKLFAFKPGTMKKITQYD